MTITISLITTPEGNMTGEKYADSAKKVFFGSYNKATVAVAYDAGKADGILEGEGKAKRIIDEYATRLTTSEYNVKTHRATIAKLEQKVSDLEVVNAELTINNNTLNRDLTAKANIIESMQAKIDSLLAELLVANNKLAEQDRSPTASDASDECDVCPDGVDEDIPVCETPDVPDNNDRKLTCVQVREIRASKAKVAVLANEYGVSKSTISEIRNNKTYKDC